MSCYANVRTAVRSDFANAASRDLDALSDDQLLALVRSLNAGTQQQQQQRQAQRASLPGAVANPRTVRPRGAHPVVSPQARLRDAAYGRGGSSASNTASRGGFGRLNILNEERVA